MAQIKIVLSAPPVDGMDIKFQAPCDCTAVDGIVIHYPAGDGSTATKELTFRDAHGNNLAGIGNLFSQGAYVKVIVDTTNGYAYLQNADTNGFLNSAILGTYTHDGENLTGYGENGKFKAATSGTISTINVNGVACDVKCGEETSMDLIAGCWYTFILDGTTVNFSSGGAGGGGLNFKVVGNPQPASPSDNTIWLDTDVDINGYIFSPTEPTDLTDNDVGKVWFATGTDSEVAFSATKKNPVMIYPLSAKQYIDGAWKDVPAQSYLDGEWVAWYNGELYSYGNEYENITGGWALSENWLYSSGGTITKNTESMVFYTALVDGSHYAHAFLRTNNIIELSDAESIILVAKSVSLDSTANPIKLVAKSTDNAKGEDVVASIGLTVSSTEQTFTLDVSTLSGSYYVGIEAPDSYGGTVEILEIKIQ